MKNKKTTQKADITTINIILVSLIAITSILIPLAISVLIDPFIMATLTPMMILIIVFVIGMSIAKIIYNAKLSFKKIIIAGFAIGMIIQFAMSILSISILSDLFGISIMDLLPYVAPTIAWNTFLAGVIGIIIYVILYGIGKLIWNLKNKKVNEIMGE